MNKKLIIGIALEPHLARLARKLIKPHEHLPLRVHDLESYHIPLCTLGWVPEDVIQEIVEIVEEIAIDTSPFDIAWRAIEGTYRTPEDRANHIPQHIRIVGEEGEEVRDLHNMFEAEFLHRQRDVNHFSPRVDLAHVRRTYWEAIPEPRPEIAIDFLCAMDVMQISVFEHAEIEGEKMFTPLAVCDLQGA